MDDPLSRNAAPTDVATASFSSRPDCRMTGMSGQTSLTFLVNCRPASQFSSPSWGNSMSEMMPSISSL